MRVKMLPQYQDWGQESGIKRVIQAYNKYLPMVGIDLVGPNEEAYDVKAVHAGVSKDSCDVAHLHGLYFTADYEASNDEWETNARVIRSAHSAKIITVPSNWVAETFRRDMRVEPIVVPHGIEAEQWAHKEPNEGYVLWNKNRITDVCDPTPVGLLAAKAANVVFASTFAPGTIEVPTNFKVLGQLEHSVMKQVVQRAAVYLSTTKETFGIGTLEALAAGVPVLGWAYGGNLDLVVHGVTGYLAEPNNYEDLLQGLHYCLKYRKELSANAVAAAAKWTWLKAAEQLAELYHMAHKVEEPTAGIVIPVYGKTFEQVERAVQSALAQDYYLLLRVVIVDDCTDIGDQLKELCKLSKKVVYLRTPANSGVANARNYGISNCLTKYITCLDADDAMHPKFLSTCIKHLEANSAVGITYTKLKWFTDDGKEGISEWPTTASYDYKRQMEHYNQIPTCNVFRRLVWERLGGYRQRYAPYGAGQEDAEFWLRIGSIGFTAEIATEEALFYYSTSGNSVYNNPDHVPTNWTAWHPWVSDGRHPFASIATPANGRSHAVRQYDQPAASVIIPVASYHLPYLVDALDSLEAQTFRSWEVICILDGEPNWEQYTRLRKAYPYARYIENFQKPNGPGWARHAGVEAARSSLVVFLDADDYLTSSFLELTVKEFRKRRGIIYTDYVDRAIWKAEEYAALTEDRKLSYNKRTGEAFIRRYSKEYDWDKAIRQPEYDPNDENSPFYVWNIVTTLLPKAWYYEVGGFDQTMDTWEDVDLYWRLARHGKPFYKVAEPGVVYRFTSGSRREGGMVRDDATAAKYRERIDYLTAKYKEIPAMPCTDCGKDAGANAAAQQFLQSLSGASGGFSGVTDAEMIECKYEHPNQGMHPVVGLATGRNYGYHRQGDTFLVHRHDIQVLPDIYVPIVSEQPVRVEEVAVPPAPPPPPPVDPFQGIAGITKETEDKLIAKGITTPADILKAGKAGLEQAGVLPRVATMILNSTRKLHG